MILQHDEDSRTLLSGASTIAIVWLSPKPYPDSHCATRHLLSCGHTIFPVNPHIKDIFGLRAHRSAVDLPSSIGIIDIFRRPEYVPGIVHDAMTIEARALRMQHGVSHPGAVWSATEAGLTVAVERCIMTAHDRLTAG